MNGLFFGNTATNASSKKTQIIRGLTTKYGLNSNNPTYENLIFVINDDYDGVLPSGIQPVYIRTTAINGEFEVILPPDLVIYSLDGFANSEYGEKLKQIEFDIDSSNLITMKHAFYYNYYLENVFFGESFGENVKHAYGMFVNCNQLESIEFPQNFGEKCETLSSAFKECTKLKTVTFGENFGKKLVKIDYMFNGCSKLQSVNFENVESEMQNIEYAFDGCNSLTLLNIPKMQVTKSVFKSTFVPNITTLTIYYNSTIFYKKFINKPNWVDVSQQ